MSLDSLYNWRTTESWKKDWGLTFLLKIGLGIFLPFFSDEAYYWVWARNLKLSYFDHPPFSAWLFWLAQPLDGFFFSSRLLFVVMGHLTLWIWCEFLAESFSSAQKRVLFWILLLHPLIGLGGLVANPDIPFLFFWSLSLVLYLKCLKNLDSWIWPSLLGMALGLGFDSKYLMGLIAPVFFLHLIFSEKWKVLRVQHIVLPVLCGFAFSLPVWLWNIQNDWLSFKFQFDHGLGQKNWKPQWTLDFLLGTAILLFPPFLYVGVKNLKKSWKNLHVVLFLSLLVFFLYTTFKGDTELNWPLVIYPSFFVFVTPLVANTKAFKLYCGFFGFISVLLLSFVFLNPSNSLHPRLQEGSLYRFLYEQTREYRPLYTNTYQAASYFYFLSQEPFYKLRFASRPDEFDSMAGSQPSMDAFYYIKQSYQYIPPSQLELFTFEKIKDLQYGFELYKAVRK